MAASTLKALSCGQSLCTNSPAFNRGTHTSRVCTSRDASPCFSVQILSRSQAGFSRNPLRVCKTALRLPVVSASLDGTSPLEAPRPNKQNLVQTGVKAAATRLILFAASVVGFTIRSVEGIIESSTKIFGIPTSEEKEIIENVRSKSQLMLSIAGPLFFAAVSGSSTASGSVNTPLTVVASGMAKWLELYSGVLLVRVLLTWFPNINWERQPMLAIRDMTDPYLSLFRNILPPLYNVLDLSPMLAFMVLGILTSILNASMA